MHKKAREMGGSFTKKEQKAALGKSFGICRGDMDEDKLRNAINQLEAEMKQKGITDPEERETYYRMRFMGEMSTGTIKTKQDYLREKLTRLQKVLKNVNPKDRKIILEEIEKIKNEIKARTYYRNYSKGVKYEDSIKSVLRPTGGRQRNLAGFHKRWGKGCEAEIAPNRWVSCVVQDDAYKKFKVFINEIGKQMWIPKSKVRFFDLVRQDASIISQGIDKAKENKQRSIFFRPYRPLETLNEVTKTSGKSSSANIEGMEYSEGMLKVTFNWEKLGEVEYGYDVGPDFYDRMAKSQSKGKFLWSELRGKTPGYVIDNPRKMTPGGVGGSIVPYTKITKRGIQGDEFKKLQKQYAKKLKGKVKVVANMPFVRPKQKVISRKSKGYGASPSLDFIVIKELSDAIPIKGHSRGGVWIPAHERKGSKAEEIKKKIKSEKIEKTPLPGAKPSKIEETFKKWKEERSDKKPEEKAQKREPRKISEEKRRKEIDRQAAKTKTTPAPEPREEAIQKLIEQTGMGREEAEKRIAKVMGLSPEQAKKKAEIKEHEIKFKAKNQELGQKLVVLRQINAKIDSIPLKNIISLFVKAFTLMATQRDPETYLKLFYGHYQKLKRDKRLVIKQKDELINQIGKIHKELELLSKKKRKAGDFEYISAAVDTCAKRAIAKAGGKGSYNAEVANCIRMIGIARRRAGMSPRPQGSAREERRAERRGRASERPERREARQERGRLRAAVEEREAERAREVRVRITAGFIRNIGEVANYIAIGNYQSATQVLREQFEKMHQISDDELRTDIEQRLQNAARTLANRVDANNTAVLSRIRTHANTFRHYIEGGTLEDARRELSNAQSDAQRIFNDVDAQRRANALVFEMQQKFDERSEREAGAERIREINRRREEREAEAANELRQFEREQEQEAAARLGPSIQLAEEQIARERLRAAIRERRQERLRESGRLPRNAESSVSGLNQSESVVSGPGLNQSESAEISQVQHEYIPGEMRPVPEGMEVTRRGHYRTHSVSGRQFWVRPSYRSISGGRPQRAAAQRAPGGRRESETQRAAREYRRTRRGQRIRWKTRISLGNRRFGSLSEIQRSDLRPGMSFTLRATASKAYEFPDPDARGGVLRLSRGQSVGGADFDVRRDYDRGGVYLYLSNLSIDDQYRGRGAASSILLPAIPMADRLNLVIGGSPSPIDRTYEVAPSHLTPRERREWSRHNSSDLLRFYEAMGGEPDPRGEYGGSYMRRPHPERIGARSSDLIRRFDQVRRFIEYTHLENIWEIDGYFFYYSPERDQYFHLDFKKKGEKK